jgi:hypothetical protein
VPIERQQTIRSKTKPSSAYRNPKGKHIIEI